MRSFFVDATTNMSTIIDAVTDTTEVAKCTASKQSSGKNKPNRGSIAACPNFAADDSPLLHGRNGPAASAAAAPIETAASPRQTSSSPARVRAERALANLRDAAQQLGVRHLAAAAAAAAAELASRGTAGAATTARLRWELRRAEAAWCAAGCAGTARAVVAAVAAVAPAGGAFRSLPGALRFRRSESASDSDPARPRAAGRSAGR
jgi:hypothetical protein